MINNIFKYISNLLFDDWQNKSVSILIAIIIFIIFYLNRIESIVLEKEFNIIVNKEMTLDEVPDFNKIKIIVKSNKDDLKYINIDKIVLFVDASKIQEPGEYNLPIKVKNLNAVPISEYNLSKSNISLKLDMKTSKTVMVFPSFKVIESESKEEYFISKYTIFPENLVIYGPKRVLDKINIIQTKEKILEANNLLISDYLELIQPDALVSLNRNYVAVNIALNKKFSNITIKNPHLIVNGLADDLDFEDKEKIEEQEGKISINIRTSLNEQEINNYIKNRNINILLDLYNIKSPGIYQIPLKIEIKSNTKGIEIIDFNPKEIEVDLNEKQ